MGLKVTYHQESGEDREYTVLAKHEDGTVDVGHEGGAAVVTKCEVSPVPAFGKVTISQPIEDEKSQKKNSTK